MKTLYKLTCLALSLCLLAGCAAHVTQNSTSDISGQQQEAAAWFDGIS